MSAEKSPPPLEELAIQIGRPYLFASRNGGDLVVGTFAGIDHNDGTLVFKNAVGLKTDDPGIHLVLARDLIAIEEWEQRIELKNYMRDKSTTVPAKRLRFVE